MQRGIPHFFLTIFLISSKRNWPVSFELLCWGQVESVGHWLHTGFFKAEKLFWYPFYCLIFFLSFFFFSLSVKRIHAQISERFFCCFWFTDTPHPVKSVLNTIVVKEKAVGPRKGNVHIVSDLEILSGASRWQQFNTRVYRGIILPSQFILSVYDAWF